VHIILTILWRLIVNDQRATFHIKTTCCNIGTAEDLCNAITQISQCLLTLLLVLIAMDGLAVDSGTIKAILELFTHLFRVAENQGAVIAFSFLRDIVLQETLCELLNFLFSIDNFDKLGDGIICLE
jgi:hypothetical protein